jgi:uncharacterized protein YggE
MGNKRKISMIAAVAAIVVAVPLFASAIGDFLNPAPAQAQSGQVLQANTIQVVGQGTISVVPDVAYISIGIQTEGKTAEEAQAANAEQFAKLEKLLYDTYKFDKKDVQSSGFYVRPEYRHDSGRAEIVGYTAIHNVSVTYRDMDNIGTLLDDASSVAANRIDGVRFGTEKHDEYQLQAMEKALANARSKAEALAGYAGKSLGSVVHISETGASSPPIIYGEAMGLASVARSDSTSIQIGELDVRATLHVTYQFE